MVIKMPQQESHRRFTRSFLLGGQLDVLPLKREQGMTATVLARQRWDHYRRIALRYFPDEKSHEYFMALALLLAHSQVRGASPNPCVGCVYVGEGGRILGMGHTQEFGGVHAEKHAQLDAESSHESLQGATAYVTLEPCVTRGKQGACVDLLVRSGISAIWIALEDPDERVQGKGVERLRRSGMQVHVGLFGECAQRLMSRYLLHRKRGGVPCLGGKWAQSLDGRFAAPSGSSRWISSAPSLIYSQWLRYVYDGMMVGAGTFIHDRPSLSLRHPFMVDTSKQPLKIIFDPHLRALSHPCFKEHYQHLKAGGARVLWLTAQQQSSAVKASASWRYLSQKDGDAAVAALDLDDIHRSLLQFFRSDLWCAHFAERGMSVLVEGGPRLYNLLLGCGLLDFLHVVVAPKWLGGPHGIHLGDGPRFPHPLSEPSGYGLVNHHAFGPDVLLEYRWAAESL